MEFSQGLRLSFGACPFTLYVPRKILRQKQKKKKERYGEKLVSVKRILYLLGGRGPIREDPDNETLKTHTGLWKRW